MAIVKIALVVVNSIQLDMLGFGLIISKVLPLGLFMAGKVYIFCLLSGAMGERKLTHWSMRILNNLFHVNFWSVMSFSTSVT